MAEQAGRLETDGLNLQPHNKGHREHFSGFWLSARDPRTRLGWLCLSSPSSRCEDVSFCFCCSRKIAQLVAYKQHESGVTVLEARMSEARGRHDWVLARACLWVAGGCLCCASMHGRRDKRIPLVLHLSDSGGARHLQTAFPQALGFQRVNREDIQTIAGSMLSGQACHPHRCSELQPPGSACGLRKKKKKTYFIWH